MGVWPLCKIIRNLRNCPIGTCHGGSALSSMWAGASHWILLRLIFIIYTKGHSVLWGPKISPVDSTQWTARGLGCSHRVALSIAVFVVVVGIWGLLILGLCYSFIEPVFLFPNKSLQKFEEILSIFFFLFLLCKKQLCLKRRHVTNKHFIGRGKNDSGH